MVQLLNISIDGRREGDREMLGFCAQYYSRAWSLALVSVENADWGKKIKAVAGWWSLGREEVLARIAHAKRCDGRLIRLVDSISSARISLIHFVEQLYRSTSLTGWLLSSFLHCVKILRWKRSIYAPATRRATEMRDCVPADDHTGSGNSSILEDEAKDEAFTKEWGLYSIVIGKIRLLRLDYQVSIDREKTWEKSTLILNWLIFVALRLYI